MEVIVTPKILTLRDPDTGGVTKLQLFHRCLSSQEDTPTDKDASCRAKNMPQRTTRYLVFFVGDDVQQAGCHPEVVRLQRPEEVCKHLLRTFEATVQDVIVVMPSRYEGGFACYDNFLDGPWDLFGEPMKSDGRYVGEGLKASRHLVNILAQVFKQHERTIWKREWILIGFSKGGAVVNQLLTEMACLGAKTVVDECVDRFFSLLREIHYVDVGLNCPGAYLTDPCVFSGLKSWFKEHINTARNQEKPSVEVPIHLHGSFRQWGGQDERSSRLVKERDAMMQGLQQHHIPVYIHTKPRNTYNDLLTEHFTMITWFGNDRSDGTKYYDTT